MVTVVSVTDSNKGLLGARLVLYCSSYAASLRLLLRHLLYHVYDKRAAEQDSWLIDVVMFVTVERISHQHIRFGTRVL